MTKIQKSKQWLVLKGFGHWILALLNPSQHEGFNRVKI